MPRAGISPFWDIRGVSKVTFTEHTPPQVQTFPVTLITETGNIRMRGHKPTAKGPSGNQKPRR